MSNKKIKGSSKKKSNINKYHTMKLEYIKKTNKLKNLIRTTILSIQSYKKMDIITASDYNICIQSLEKIYDELNNIVTSLKNNESNIDYKNIAGANHFFENKTEKLINEVSKYLDSRLIGPDF